MPGIRVLLVDDDAQFRRLVRDVLTPAGIRTTEAGPAHDVVDLAEREQPDLILLDWRMPGESGLQLCRRLKAHPGVQHVPVVILTGLSDPRDRDLALRSGAAAMVTKGGAVDLVRLVRTLAQRGDGDGDGR